VVGVLAFKRYDQKQTFLFPLSLEDFVGKGHPARTISEVVDTLDFSKFLEQYHVRGASSYDPWMMLKVLFYAYYNGKTSSREIANYLQSDTAFMYLAGMQRPDHRTICRFRTAHREGIEDAFRQIVVLCMALGMVGLGNVSFDGTKIKANASLRKTKDKDALDKRIKKLLDESEKKDREEDELYGEGTQYEVPPSLHDPKERRRRIQEELEKLKKAKDRLEKSGEKNTNLTDPEARLMKTGEGVKPAYNGQTAVDGKCQVILAAKLVDKGTDNAELIPMIELVEDITGRQPWVSTADSGYGGHDNLEYLEKRGLFALIPDVMYRVEKLGKAMYYPRSLFKYNEMEDSFICPEGKVLAHSGSTTYKGHKLESYRCKEKECQSCPKRAKCTDGEFRKISWNERDYLVTDMRKRLDTRLGETIYKERMSIVEPVYGEMKKNRRFHQFNLRGLTKTGIEFLLLCLTHNLKKIHNHLQEAVKALQTDRNPRGSSGACIS
jgi:transposase